MVKAAERAELAKDGLARKLFILNKMIAPEGDFILGEKIGLADVAIWRMCGWLSAGLDGIPTEILSAFPHILRVCKISTPKSRGSKKPIPPAKITRFILG